MVGNYAIQIKWKDGYDYGYTLLTYLQDGVIFEVKGNINSD